MYLQIYIPFFLLENNTLTHTDGHKKLVEGQLTLSIKIIS